MNNDNNDNNDTLIKALCDEMRYEKLDRKERIIVSLMLLAWWKISNRLDLGLPENLKINKTFDNLNNVFFEIFDFTKDESFNEEHRLIVSKVNFTTLVTLVDLILTMGSNGILEKFNPSDASLLGLQHGSLPEEVVDFMVSLAQEIVGKEVYLPWEMTGQFTGRVICKKGLPIIESEFYTGYSNLIATIISDTPIKVLNNDVYANPGVVDVELGKLRKLPIAIANLIVRGSLRQVKVITDYDLFERFKYNSKSTQGRAISHLLMQIKGRIIIMVPQNFLFTGADRELRTYLVRSQILEAVVSMPTGLIDTASASFSIVILNTDKASSKVRFVNANVAEYISVVPRDKNKLINFEKLSRLVIDSKHEDYNVRDVSIDEILEKNADLVVSSYILDAIAKHAEQMLGVALYTFAKLISPKTLAEAVDGIEVAEVGAQDLPNFGYIQSASKTLNVAIDRRKIKDLFLRPDDIVLVIKGSVGKVGIVPADAPLDYWLAGRSSVVIRVDDNRGNHQGNCVNPKALYMLLRSDLGREILNRLFKGSTVSFIKLSQLQDLIIPLPTQDETEKAIEVLEEEAVIQKEIMALHKRQSELSLDFWKLNNN